MAEVIAMIRDRLRGLFGAISPSVGVTVAPAPTDVYALTIAVDNPSPQVGQTIHFTGRYTKNGVGVGFYEVALNKNGVGIGYSDTDASGNYSTPYLCNVAGSFTFTTQTTDPGTYGTTGYRTTRFRGSVSDPVSINVTEDGDGGFPKPIRTFIASLLERFRGA